jgi:hypothetical protein
MRYLIVIAILASTPVLAQTESYITGGEYLGASQSRGKEKFIYGRRGPGQKGNSEKAIRDDFFYGGYGEPVGQVFTDQNEKD